MHTYHHQLVFFSMVSHQCSYILWLALLSPCKEDKICAVELRMHASQRSYYFVHNAFGRFYSGVKFNTAFAPYTVAFVAISLLCWYGPENNLGLTRTSIQPDRWVEVSPVTGMFALTRCDCTNAEGSTSSTVLLPAATLRALVRHFHLWQFCVAEGQTWQIPPQGKNTVRWQPFCLTVVKCPRWLSINKWVNECVSEGDGAWLSVDYFSSHRQKAKGHCSMGYCLLYRTPGSLLYWQWQTSPLQVLIRNEQRGLIPSPPANPQLVSEPGLQRVLVGPQRYAMSGQLRTELLINNKAPGCHCWLFSAQSP